MTRLLIPLVADVRPDAELPVIERLGVAGPLTAWTHAVATAADECLLVDPVGHVVACSPAAARLLGVSMSALLGRSLVDSVRFVGFGAHAESAVASGLRLAPETALRTGATARCLARVQHDGGRLVTCDVVAVPLHDATRRLLAVLVHLAEVSGR